MCPIERAPRLARPNRPSELDRARSTIGAARALGWKDGVRDASYTRDDATCRDEGRYEMDASSEDDASDDASSSVVVTRG